MRPLLNSFPFFASPSLVAALAMIAGSASGADFTTGNLVVYRVGTGSGALASAATAVYLDEYTTAGVLVQSLALPTAASGANFALTATGTATSEGLMTRSTNGQYLVLTGYNAAPGTTSVSTSVPTATARIVGRVDASGTIDTTTALSDLTGNPRSVASVDGSELWVTSSSAGIRYALFGATTSTSLSTLTNVRQTRIFDSQLYLSSSSGAFRLASVGLGIPETSGQTVTNLPGFPTTGGSPYGFFFADLDAGVAGVDTVYVSDDGGGAATGILKYSLVGGSWVANGNLVAAGIRSLTGSISGSSVTLYGASNTKIFTLTDATGYNAAIAGTVAEVTTATTNTNFRGIDWAPTGGTPLPPIEIWRKAKFGPGATNSGTAANDADFDFDGVPNLVEYGLGTDPVSALASDGAASLPSAVTGSSDPLLTDRLAMAFNISKTNPVDITYIVQASDDLVNWTPLATKIGAADWVWNPGGTAHLVITTAGDVTTVQVGDAVATADAGRRQLRLKITNP